MHYTGAAHRTVEDRPLEVGSERGMAPFIVHTLTRRLLHSEQPFRDFRYPSFFIKETRARAGHQGTRLLRSRAIRSHGKASVQYKDVRTDGRAQSQS